MVRHDEVSPNGSNGSSPDANVETGKGTLEIDGHEFEYRETNDEIEVEIPDDFPEDKKPELERKAEEFKNTLASAKRKSFEANRKLEDLDERERRLREEEEAFERKQKQLSQSKTPDPDDNALLTAFGVETWDDVTALQVEDPKAYHKGIAKYNATIASQDAYNRLQGDNIRRTMEAEGYNPNTVEAFAKANGITRIDVAYDYYKRVNIKPKGQSLADIQKKTVKFVPKGTGSSHSPKTAPSMKELKDSTE